MSVSAPFVWRCLSGSTMAPFPHPAHRTQQVDFPHCAARPARVMTKLREFQYLGVGLARSISGRVPQGRDADRETAARRICRGRAGFDGDCSRSAGAQDRYREPSPPSTAPEGSMVSIAASSLIAAVQRPRCLPCRRLRPPCAPRRSGIAGSGRPPVAARRRVVRGRALPIRGP
jgi:hypothetical protein